MDTALRQNENAPQTNKSDIFILSNNDKHRHEISNALLSFYVVHTFKTPKEAIEALNTLIPTAIVLDQDFSKQSGLHFLYNIRKTKTLQLLPVVYTATNGAKDHVQTSKSMACVRTLEKPYRFSALLSAISDQVNAHVEATWEMLEPVQKEALENTLDSFNSIADLVAEGKQVPYNDIQASCEPLVTAVQSGSFKQLLQGVRGHDNYSYVHSLRVATFLSLFGDYLGMKGNDLSILTTGGLLHDVGKMLIPHQVLNKPGRLDDQELVVMRSHVTETISFLENTHDIPRGVGVIAAQHHEKLDGTGYPYGLKGSELNDLARMAAIIDIFSALTDRRCYKDPMSPVQAMKIMEEMEGHLDMHFLRAFKELLLDAASENDDLS